MRIELYFAFIHDNKIEIYIAAHKKFEVPKNDIYIPLHVGAFNKADLGFLKDSTKKNITEIINYCKSQTESKVFPTYIADYINFLPNYTADNYNTGSKYRVIVVVQHKKALNNYYSFSTMEVNR